VDGGKKRRDRGDRRFLNIKKSLGEKSRDLFCRRRHDLGLEKGQEEEGALGRGEKAGLDLFLGSELLSKRGGRRTPAWGEKEVGFGGRGEGRTKIREEKKEQDFLPLLGEEGGFR